MSYGKYATTPTRPLVPTDTRCHRIGKSSAARRDTTWDEASSARTIKRSEGRKCVETTQARDSVTCGVNRDGLVCQWDGPVQMDGDVRRRLRRTAEALASVIADERYAPTINQIIAAG